MKIAVTSQGADLSAAIDERFGRARYLILVDTETGAREVVDNAANLNAAQGAGIQAAEAVLRNGAEAVLTGHCGPKAFRMLRAGGAAVYTGLQGSVKEAVDSFKRGELAPAASADVESHW